MPPVKNSSKTHDRYDPAINRLTVIASESFEDYAKNLQTEMEKDIGGGFKFGRVPSIAFAPLTLEGEASLEQEKSKQLWQALKAEGYIDKQGNITAKFQPDDLHFQLTLPQEYQPIESEVIDKLRSFMFAGRVKNERSRTAVTYNKRVELNPDFKVLWDKISQKTQYRVAISPKEVVLAD